MSGLSIHTSRTTSIHTLSTTSIHTSRTTSVHTLSSTSLHTLSTTWVCWRWPTKVGKRSYLHYNLAKLFFQPGFLSKTILTFFKWANSGLFLFISAFSHYNFNNTNWKKLRWCALDLNPQLQEGRCRQNHGAMAAAQPLNIEYIQLVLDCLGSIN